MSSGNIVGESSPILVRSNRPGWVSLTVSPTLHSKEHVAAIFRSHLDALPVELCEALLLALDELLSNAIEHGCELDPHRRVDVALIRTDRIILIYVRDDGEGFSVADLFHSALNNPPGNPLHHVQMRDEMGLRPGGFGIMLAKQVADELIYNESGNAVMLIKYLSGFPS